MYPQPSVSLVENAELSPALNVSFGLPADDSNILDEVMQSPALNVSSGLPVDTSNILDDMIQSTTIDDTLEMSIVFKPKPTKMKLEIRNPCWQKGW